MEVKQLRVAPGTWVVANCARFPSEKNCQLVIMAPRDQRRDLVEAASVHAVKNHGHKDTPELRKEVDGFLEIVEVR